MAPSITKLLAAGTQHHAAGRLAEAEALYRMVLDLDPQHSDALAFLGVARHKQGDVANAHSLIVKAIGINPSVPHYYCNLALVLGSIGRGGDAIQAYRHALQLKPDYAEAHYNLGILLKDQGDMKAAIECYRQTIRLKPDFSPAYNSLGNALRQDGQLADSIRAFQLCLQLDPHSAAAHNNLANAHRDQGEHQMAIAHYRRAIDLRPGFAEPEIQLLHLMQQVCDWSELGIVSTRVIEHFLRETSSANSPFVIFSLPTSHDQQLRCAQNYSAKRFSGFPTLEHDHTARRFSGNRKIRVGYISGDFREHAVSFLTAEMIGRHDRRRFEVIGYSFGPDDRSPIRQRMIDGFDKFIDIRPESYDQSARRIREDRIDILVDLAGYTQGARTQVLAQKPASIQVSYLGYIGTMGASFMDYIIVDPYVVPADQQDFYTERLVHLPECYQVNDGNRPRPQKARSREEHGLPDNGFVFCSFNNSYKITPEIFDVWMRLLRKTPGSVVWLQASNRFMPDNLKREARMRGVDPDRLVFSPVASYEDYLAQYNTADLFLDTLPYNAGTTASDALWMGCPVVTCPGDTFVSRMAGSLLHAIGLPELATSSLNDYESLALRIAHEPELLADLKRQIERNRLCTPLFDCGRFIGNLESAYEIMWQRYIAGMGPIPIVV